MLESARTELYFIDDSITIWISCLWNNYPPEIDDNKSDEIM